MSALILLILLVKEDDLIL